MLAFVVASRRAFKLSEFWRATQGICICCQRHTLSRQPTGASILTNTTDIVDLDAISAAEAKLAGKVIRTPVVDVRQSGLEEKLPKGSTVTMKLELFQKAGSFKARGAYLSIDALSEKQRGSGVVAASGGNHGLAVSWAARAAGVSAKIAIPQAADPFRIEACENLGADVVLCDDIAAAFETMEEIEKQENRVKIHPFEGISMTLGAATCAKEFYEDAVDLDAVILPVGGGGLISGMSAAFKLLNPEIKVYGVEPLGADTLYRSLKARAPQSISKVDTIADSLGSPTALPFSFALAQKYVDEVVRVSDDDLRATMTLMSQTLKLMPEPACAASLAGALGPLRVTCEGQRVGLLACGSNIGLERFCALTSH